ncbi:MAG TPA: carboxypeptidase-like regulatory domain-containing protein [Candidatus Thermoplasmatota archaeon]|nr:carboxypeptidase-like regulatory domain-containing protein [Candidatus Thermoplasmatota archaeon]
MLRPLAASLLLGLLALAGCAGGDEAATQGHPADPTAAGSGRLCVVAVDEAIRPVAGANVTVRLADGSAASGVSGEDGKACLDLPPGTYIVSVAHIHQTYRPAQTTADVVAGREATVKVQLDRLFVQEPYHETVKFEGFIQCGYSVSSVISSICFQDYTHFVGPTTCPECEHVFDNRGTTLAVGGGWQTQVYEMTWDPSAQGTSPEMSLTVSFYPRVASHWYCQGGGPVPVLVRLESGVTCEESQGDPQPFPPEGLNNTYFFAASKAPAGQPASATFNQRFTSFINIFYYGKPPEGWSFIGGSEFPF